MILEALLVVLAVVAVAAAWSSMRLAVRTARLEERRIDFNTRTQDHLFALTTQLTRAMVALKSPQALSTMDAGEVHVELEALTNGRFAENPDEHTVGGG